MATTGLRELRQDASALIRRAEAGERIIVTVSGRPVAEIGPVRSPRRWRHGDDVTAVFTEPVDEEWAQDLRGFDQSLRDPFEHASAAEEGSAAEDGSTAEDGSAAAESGR